MLRRYRDRLDFTRRLGFRLIALLSMAILPIGLMSLVQNLHLSRDAQQSAEIALLGRTASAAAGERALLISAMGSADALGPAVLETMDRADDCSDLMRNFIQRSATYLNAIFVPLDGVSYCSSSLAPGETMDMHGNPIYQQFLTEPGTMIKSVNQGALSGRSVVVVLHPLYRDSEMLGYIALSLTQELLRSTHAINFGTEGARIVTFNNRGEILTSDSAVEGFADDILPADTPLLSMLSRNDTTFRAQSVGGEMRVFTVVPVVPGLVYAIGSWSPKVAGIGLFQLSRFGALIFPVVLWLVSLGVAYFAVFRLVLRHISVLRGQMRRFALGNRDAPPPVLGDAPTEIRDVSQTFHNMARILIRDEEAMEDAVTEKTVLLKEVHHRVKNNLQLIASIINMQSRMIEDDDAKRVLRSVQDRVAALATIYRNLYQAEHLDAVEADRLIGDIINQMVNASVGPGSNLRVETSLQPLTLLPDQAVPLSLLATEAFTNALKYAGAPPGADGPWVRVTLQAEGDGQGLLEIENSIGVQRGENESTGLGSQLIEAFSTQLEGSAETRAEKNSFMLRLHFRIESPLVVAPQDTRNVVLTSAARDGAIH
ncbi:sensor histidine kinase [Paracoccus seriniphilus]|uniref:histidine kinase n=1 Tax=Paracoccus seriniphilus TaxID=184748 RepID=A0A239PYC6_9RHOB|nr:sensor histidine kinase [Paracoccus seriniphilus]WCR14075.1 sensor histidine kinase [Paracoccus seriniphilus]SNT74976.1 Two-component sensor histidine kinase, contains HisKA and HATPase domains [Paracoccus seriniphilus]